MKYVGVLLVLTLSITTVASKTEYVSGTLTDLHRTSTRSGAARAQGSFCLALTVGDIGYIVRQESYWRWGYEPTDLVVGDKVDVRISGNNLYLHTPSGKEVKTSISRRERVGKEPPNCGLPVTVN